MRLNDTEFDLVHSAITTQVSPLKDAYLRGMAKAENDEQGGALRELRRLVGPPRDA